jgi:HPt (histidine-containing phosphotransfer) domain-containing protein
MQDISNVEQFLAVATLGTPSLMQPFAYISPRRIVDALMPTRALDHEAARGSRLVVRVALLTLCVSALMQVVYLAENARAIALITAISIVLQLLGLALHRATGSFRVGGHLHILALWALFFGIAALSGGIESPNIVANLFIVVLAPMLLGRRHGLFWLAAVAFTYLGQFLLASHGLVQQTLAAADISATRLTELTVTSITAGTTAYVFAKGEERMRAEIAREKHLIESANTDLRIILDNTGQGFLSLDAEGRVIGERSAVIEAWLPDCRTGVRFSELLKRLDPDVASRFESEWSQVEAGFLPLEVCLEQLPKLVLAGDSSLSLAYRAVLAQGETVEKFVVIISDISAEVARKEAEVRQRDLLEAFERILRDPDSFGVFLKSARRDVSDIGQGTLVGGELRRCLHTLKGNSAMMGLSALARVCHDLEDELEQEAALGVAGLRALEREFQVAEARLLPFVARHTSDLDLRREEHDEFVRSLRSRKPHHELLQQAKSWTDRRVARDLARLAEYGETLASRLGKGEIRLEVSGGDLRMPPAYADFWDVAVHVVRNAVDHGLEPPALRDERGKGPGRLHLKAHEIDGRVVVEIGDDGRGIDWGRIEAVARERGLPHESAHDLLEALLSDGFSTSATVTEISGRGVGMGSVRKVCANLGIVIDVQSSEGAGATFRFAFPELARDRLARAAG